MAQMLILQVFDGCRISSLNLHLTKSLSQRFLHSPSVMNRASLFLSRINMLVLVGANEGYDILPFVNKGRLFET